MSLLRRIAVAAGLFWLVLSPSYASAGLVVSDPVILSPVNGVVPVPPGGFTIATPVGITGYIDFSLDGSEPEPLWFTYEYSLVDLRPGGGWDLILESGNIGGYGIRVDPGQTFRSGLGFGEISPTLLNSMVDPGQTELNLKVVVTKMRAVPFAELPEPSSVALTCSAAPLVLVFAWKRRRNSS